MSTLKSRWPAMVLAAALVLAGVASVAYAAGVASVATGGSSAAAAATTIPGHPELGSGWMAPQAMTGAAPQAGRGMMGPGMMGQGGVDITINGIDGTRLSLQTSDGWTRTIDTAGAAITKAGKKISVSDMKVGDKITFRQQRQSDGSYKITTITVVVPTVSGTVTAVTSGSVTISQPGNKTKTLTINGSTTYSQGGATAAQSALVVGARIVAQGTVDSSGNFTAVNVTIAPSVVMGTVTGKTASTIVVKTAAGKSVTINVTASTKYVVRGVKSATLANVAVGNRVSAQGALSADGSLTATSVQASPNGQPNGRGFPGWGGGKSAKPSAAPSGASI